MKSGKEFRDEILWRSSFESDNRWGIPMMKRQDWVGGQSELIAFSDTRPHENEINKTKGVHCFVDDPRFAGLYRNPYRTLSKVSQYKFLLSPDDSVYAEASPWLQMRAVAHNRWVGAFWQSQGLICYPSIAWGTPQTFEFCFLGAARGSTVAIATYACKLSRQAFLQGYVAMLDAIEPEHIICFGEPFLEMREVDLLCIPSIPKERRL